MLNKYQRKTINWNNMVEQIIKNFKSSFKEGLIINAKHRNYSVPNKFKLEELCIFYDYLTKRKLKNQKKIKYIICDLYYLSVKMQKARDVFNQCVMRRINPKDPINDANMYIIFNIIEFEEKYRVATETELQFFLKYLNNYNEHTKNDINSILFFYYRSVLHYFLKEYDEFKKDNKDITNFIKKKKSNPDVDKAFLEYIELKNWNMLLRYEKKKSVDIEEPLKSLTQQNKILEIKIGLNICQLYIKNNKFPQCLDLLTKLYQLLKEGIFSEEEIKNGIYYYYCLAVLSLTAYCSTIDNKKKKLSSVIKKIKKKLEFLYITNEKKNYYKAFFDFLVLLYQINLGINNLQTEEIINKFKKIFKLESDSDNGTTPDISSSEFSWLFKDYIPLYINIYVFEKPNSKNTKISKYISDSFCFLKTPSGKEEELPPKKKFFNGILGLYNLISKQSIQIIKEKNNTSLREEIQKHCELLFSYLNTKSHLIKKFLVPYVKEAIIKLFYVYLNTYFNVKNYKKTKEKLEDFENNLAKNLNIEENQCIGYEYILKIKGDLAFQNSQYKDAIFNYDKALKIEEESEGGIKKIITFNKGLSHLCLNEIDIGVKCLKEAQLFFRAMTENKDKLIFSKTICDDLEGKIENVNKLLGSLSND